MNVVNKIKLIFSLSKESNYYFVMPDGLYNEDNKKIKGSEILTPYLLKKFLIGDTISFEKPERFKFIIDILNLKIVNYFKLRTGIFSHNQKINFINSITISEVLEEIEKFKTRKNKNIYEEFLELMIILLFIESIKNSKIMMGGIWLSKEVKESGKRVSGYENFVKNLNSRNEIVEKIKPYLENYKKYYIEEIGLFKVIKYRNYISDYSIFLEYLYLQIFLKNTI